MESLADIKRAYFLRVLEDLYNLAHRTQSDEVARRALTDIARFCAPRPSRSASPSELSPKRQRGASSRQDDALDAPIAERSVSNPSPLEGEGRVRGSSSAPQPTPEEVAHRQILAEQQARDHHVRCTREDINTFKLNSVPVPPHYVRKLVELTGEDHDAILAARAISQDEFDAIHPEVPAYARQRDDTS